MPKAVADPVEDDKVEDTVPGVVEDDEEAARLAREEADDAGVTPAAVMRSTPEAGVTGDGVVMDPSGPDADDVEDAKDGAKKGSKKK